MKMNEPVGKNTEVIEFKLNGDTVSAWAGETIIQAAKRHGVDIPHLCYKEGYRPDGNCRACVVEIKGERVLAPSCCRQPAKGMEVSSNNERAVHSQKMVVELLMSDVPKDDLKPGGNELFHWAGELGVTHSRFPMRHQPVSDVSHPAMTVNLDACIQCTPCRAGTVKAAQLMQAPRWNRELLEDLSVAMADASICGLGQAAPNPVLSVLKYFPSEIT